MSAFLSLLIPQQLSLPMTNYLQYICVCAQNSDPSAVNAASPTRKSLLIHEKPHLNYDSFFFFVRICHCRWPCPRPPGFLVPSYTGWGRRFFFLFSIPDVVQQSDSRGIHLSPARSDSAFQERQHPLPFR
uniref:(northern house mosquito) hypothetical protein n=1 Tax=Culex pipiens TaxID=7175 RepID=A0A8D8F8N3_CULPI